MIIREISEHVNYRRDTGKPKKEADKNQKTKKKIFEESKASFCQNKEGDGKQFDSLYRIASQAKVHYFEGLEYPSTHIKFFHRRDYSWIPYFYSNLGIGISIVQRIFS